MAEDIRSGNWSLTHQAIAFDAHGVLMDGQHRLWAVVEAERSIDSWVGFDFDPSVRADVDSVTPRSITDQLNIGGENGAVSTKHVACAKAMVRGLRCGLSFTTREMQEVFRRHDKVIRYAVERVIGGSRRAGIGIAPVRAVIARAWYCLPEKNLDEFCRMLTTGMVTDPHYAAVVLLRDFLLENARRTDAAAATEKYAKTQRALVAFLNRRPLSQLRAVQAEYFPLPEEVGA